MMSRDHISREYDHVPREWDMANSGKFGASDPHPGGSYEKESLETSGSPLPGNAMTRGSGSKYNAVKTDINLAGRGMGSIVDWGKLNQNLQPSQFVPQGRE